jgi:hypothetical protein
MVGGLFVGFWTVLRDGFEGRFRGMTGETMRRGPPDPGWAYLCERCVRGFANSEGGRGRGDRRLAPGSAAPGIRNVCRSAYGVRAWGRPAWMGQGVMRCWSLGPLGRGLMWSWPDTSPCRRFSRVVRTGWDQAVQESLGDSSGFSFRPRRVKRRAGALRGALRVVRRVPGMDAGSDLSGGVLGPPRASQGMVKLFGMSKLVW